MPSAREKQRVDMRDKRREITRDCRDYKGLQDCKAYKGLQMQKQVVLSIFSA